MLVLTDIASDNGMAKFLSCFRGKAQSIQIKRKSLKSLRVIITVILSALRTVLLVIFTEITYPPALWQLLYS